MLEKNDGNKTKTADDLGISPVTLWRKLSGTRKNKLCD